MRLKKWLLDWWKNFLGFPVILEETRIKIPEFGDHLTEFGRAWKAQTQDCRKNMFFTWIMNNSVFGRFLDVMRPYNSFNSHISPSPEIWFETEHFEFLSFRGLGSVSGLFTNWDWNHSRGQTQWNLKNWWVDLISTRRDEQNPEIVSKSEDFLFFSEIFVKTQFLQKSRSFSSETVKKILDKLNKGYKNL